MTVRTWIEEVEDFSRIMTVEEFELILSRTNLECQKCGTCCIIPKLPFVNKPPNVRCQYLTDDNLCKLHDKDKPQGCQDYPYMEKKDWVCGWKLAPPRVAIWFCGIVRAFWQEAYKYLQEGGC